MSPAAETSDLAPDLASDSKLPRTGGPLPVRLLFWNVFLLKPRPIPGGPGLPSIGEIAAPAVADRARAIGDRLFGRFDIMAFSEAFDPRERRRILDGWQGRPRVSSVAGPERSLLHGPLGFASSGLFTIVNRLLMYRVERHQFATRGSYLHDADALANKGVLMVEVDPHVGGGHLEVYSTHLFYGMGLLPSRAAEDLRRRHEIRMAQLDELVAFVERVHRPENVIAIVGDFNVPAEWADYPDGPTAQYDDMMRRLAKLGVRDVWADHGIGAGDTCGLAADGFEDQLAPDLPDVLVDLEDAAGATDPVHAAARYRIDYLFVQDACADHTVAFDIEEPHRWAFPRDADAPDRDRLPRLSDHLAVSVRLLPRRV